MEREEVYDKLRILLGKGRNEIETGRASILPKHPVTDKLLTNLYSEQEARLMIACFDKCGEAQPAAELAEKAGVSVSELMAAFDDMNEIIDFAWKEKSKGVIYVGGGVPKNFIQQSLQFSSGADYGIQITTDQTSPGGSSGAPLEEGKSWGKLKVKAKYVDVFCDATIALPLIFSEFI